MSQRFVASLLTVAVVLGAGIASAQTLTVITPSTHSESKALRDLDHGNADTHGMTEIRHHHGQLPDEPEMPPLGPDVPDGALQSGPGPLISASAGTDFEGLGQNGYIPSDNNIAVSPNYIVETVNVRYGVYDKAGNLLKSGLLGSLWTGMTGCGGNGGDPVVQYDRFADRWILSQLGSSGSTYYECIAVSTSNDPQGTYHLYSYTFVSSQKINQLNDYPKFGVWPTATNSAYLATYNLFNNGQTGAGAELCAYDRTAMLAGAVATGLCFTGLTTYSYLPSDVDGPTPPLDGTPGYFVDLLNTSSLGVYTIAPNFATKTATLSPFSTTPSTIGVDAFTQAVDVPQPASGSPLLDSLNDRLMYRLAFRTFGDHESMVVNHSTQVSTGNNGARDGVRWYELRSPVATNGTFTLYQQGTFAPDDGAHRWMGSIAMDQQGDMGLGYSVSGSSQNPSIRYTGRVPSDALGTMETESSLKEGLGSQTGYNRWGDYSSMRIDPSDDCTFWYVNEYYTMNASYDWHTRIGSFKFDSCGTPPTPDFSLSASPTSQTVAQGVSAQYTITANSIGGFGGSVALSIQGGCPATFLCSFSVNPVNAGSSSMLTVTPSGSAPTTPVGTYNVIVQGVSGATHTTSVSITVTDFSLSANPTSFSRAQGQSGTSTITVNAINGYTGVTSLIVLSGCPLNTTCSLSSGSVNAGGSSTLTVATTATTPIGGPYNVVVQGTSAGGVTHQTTVAVTVTAPATNDFTISLSPGSLTVRRSHNGTVTVTITMTGANIPVAFSISGLPLHTSATFTPTSRSTPGSSTLRISATSTAVPGTYPVTVTGTSGAIIHSVPLSLIIR
jgi:hypothetical protein